VELDQFDLAKEKGFWGFRLFGFLCRGLRDILGFIKRDLGRDLICSERGTIFPKRRAQL
jgi:hypothetical protein